MVSLDEFIVFNTPNSSCDNRHYIGSDRLKTLTYAFLIGDNKIYQRHKSYWLLKAVLVEDKLLVDYSFEDIDLLEEQILILSAFDREVTIKWETLWEYFNVADVNELNKISRQLVDRRLDEIANPLKVFYNNAIDDGKTQLDYAEWEVEMNELLVKWKECEEARLLPNYTVREITNYLATKDLNWFIREYYNNSIVFYTPPDVHPQAPNVTQDLYSDSLQILMESSGMDESSILPEDGEELNTYIGSINRLVEDDEDINYEDVTRHATNVYNYHRITHPLLEDVTIDHPF